MEDWSLHEERFENDEEFHRVQFGLMDLLEEIIKEGKLTDIHKERHKELKGRRIKCSEEWSRILNEEQKRIQEIERKKTSCDPCGV